MNMDSLSFTWYLVAAESRISKQSGVQGESQVNVFHLLVEIGLLPFYEHGFLKLHLVLSGCRVQDLEAIRCAGCSTKL